MAGAVTLTAVYEPVENGWVQVHLEELPEVITAAPTREEAEALIDDALAEYLAALDSPPTAGPDNVPVAGEIRIRPRDEAVTAEPASGARADVKQKVRAIQKDAVRKIRAIQKDAERQIRAVAKDANTRGRATRGADTRTGTKRSGSGRATRSGRRRTSQR